MEQSYTKSAAEVLKHFNVREARGLSSQQVKDNRTLYGSNCKATPKSQPALQLTMRSAS